MKRTASPGDMADSDTPLPAARTGSIASHSSSRSGSVIPPTLALPNQRRPSATPTRPGLRHEDTSHSSPVGHTRRVKFRRRAMRRRDEESSPPRDRPPRRRSGSGSSDDSEDEWPWVEKYGERYPPQDIATFNELDKRYPPDRFGEEATDNARVWKVYRERAAEQDEDQLEGWNKTLDILLIFAALFSAVATAFIIESYKALQPDYSQIAARALVASLNPDRSAASTELEEELDAFKSPKDARWVNGLWFASLILSLGVSLLSILAKQWLDEYTSRMRRPVASLRRWAWRHILYNDALAQWGIGAMVSSLPFILHISVFLFFAGLIIWLQDFDDIIAAVACGLVGVLTAFYVVATLLPLVYGSCPSVTPLLRLTHRGFAHLKDGIQKLFNRDQVDDPDQSAPFDEKRLMANKNFDMRAFKTMITTLPSEDDSTIALDAVGCLDASVPEYEALYSPAIQELAVNRLRAIGQSSASFAAIARCIRTIIFVRVHDSELSDSTRQQLLAICGRLREVKNFDMFLLATTLACRLRDDGQNRLATQVVPLLHEWRNYQIGRPGGPLGAPFHPTTLSAMLNSSDKWELRSLLPLLDFTSWHGMDATTSMTITQGELALKQIITLVLRALEDGIKTRCGNVEAKRHFQRLSLLLADDPDMAHFVPQIWVFVHTYQNDMAFLQDLDEEAPFGTAGPILPNEMRNVLAGQLLSATAFLASSGRSLQNTLRLDQLLHTFDIERVFIRPWFKGTCFGLGDILTVAGQTSSAHWSPTLNRLTFYVIQAMSGEVPMGENLICDLTHSITLPDRCSPSGEVLKMFASPEEAISNTRLNILVPFGEQIDGKATSTWMLMWKVILERPRDRIVLSALASYLLGMIINLHRTGFDVSNLFHDLMGDGQGAVLIREAPHPEMKWDLALHGREIAAQRAPEWWSETKAALLLDLGDWPYKEVFKGPDVFVGNIEAASPCHRCPSGGIAFTRKWRNPVRSRGVTSSAPPSPPHPTQGVGKENWPGLPENIGVPPGTLPRVPTRRWTGDSMNNPSLYSRPHNAYRMGSVPANDEEESLHGQPQFTSDPTENV